jgi:CheY-like chemotaxis protein/anti-sigma regulatory factor (Ser/Thr protein kinase)
MAVKVLIADQDSSFALFLELALRNEGYEVRLAPDSDSAHIWLESFQPDVLITEIQIPGSGGFELIRHAMTQAPDLLCVILTEEDVDRHLSVLHELRIAHVYTKGVPFHSAEFLVRLRQSLEGNIFGLDPFLDEVLEESHWTIRSPADIEDVTRHVAQHCPLGDRNKHLQMVLTEVLTNAVFYGARSEKGEEKLDWDRDFELAEDQAIQMRLAKDQLRIGISVTDPGGKLDRDTVLYWLRRQTPEIDGCLPEGVLDTHGRGLFITRRLMDRVYFNVEKGVRSECVLLLYRDIPTTTYKPLSILEV